MAKVYSLSILFVLLILISACKKGGSGNPNPPPPPPPPPPPVVQHWKFESTILWEENFNYSGVPDTTKWGYDIGGNGWGNNELQYYTTAGNTMVESGTLKITAKKENFSGRAYTSARMVSRNKADWLYGRIEVKAKLPRGRGSWPAIWMLPTDWSYGNWPNSGEIDLMEHVGYDQNRVHFTIHTQAYNHMIGTQRGQNKIIPTASDEFHLYRLDWASYGIRGYFDNELVFEFINPGGGYTYWPFDQKFHLLLNIAVGGNWGGLQGVDDTIFPIVLEIDHIKVYKFLE